LIVPVLISDIFNNLPYLLGKYRDVPALLLLPCAAVFVPFMVRPLGQAARWLTVIAAVVAFAIALVMAATSAGYLTETGYLDHVEASIAAVSWWYHTGHPLYPAWNDGQGVYGFQYGPLLFQITAAALRFGPSILMSKLPGFLSFWLACAVVLWALRPSLPSVGQSLLPVAALILVAGSYWRAAYWVRGDPQLLLFAALGLWSWRRLDRTAAAIAIGLLGGGLMNLKVHGALYVLPYAVALLESPGSTATRVRTAGIGIASGIFAAVLPFLDPDVSLVNYAAFIDLALHHGLDRYLLLSNIRFSCVLVLPVLFLAWRHFRGEPQPNMLMGLVYCLSVFVVCVIGGKKGAGPTHLIPFLPAFVFLLVRAARTARTPNNEQVQAGSLAVYFLAAAIAYLPSFASNLVRLQAWSRTTNDPAFLREAEQLYADYPSAVMGAGGSESATLTEYKMVGVFAGGPLVFDTSTWMDLDGAGVPDEVIERLLIDCRTPFWIIPNGGAPFTQTAAYDDGPQFSDRFRELFQQGYRPVRKGEFYSVWACRDTRPGGR
jgi:hypothetical protein